MSDSNIKQNGKDLAALQHRVIVLEETLARLFTALEANQETWNRDVSEVALDGHDLDETTGAKASTMEYYLGRLQALSSNGIHI